MQIYKLVAVDINVRNYVHVSTTSQSQLKWKVVAHLCRFILHINSRGGLYLSKIGAQVLVHALVISKFAISSLLLYYADVQPLQLILSGCPLHSLFGTL